MISFNLKKAGAMSSCFAIFGLMILTILPEASWGSGNFEFDRVIFRGSGCPLGTASYVTSPDNQVVSIIFDTMSVEVPQFDGDNDNDEVSDENPSIESRSNKKVDHKICHIDLLAKLPVNSQLDVIDISLDLRGHTFATKGVDISLKSFFKGFQGVAHRGGNKKIMIKKRWRNATDESWTISRKMTVQIKSKCSGQQKKNIRLKHKNILMAKIKGRSNDSTTGFLMLDTSDIAGRMKFEFKISQCR